MLETTFWSRNIIIFLLFASVLSESTKHAGSTILTTKGRSQKVENVVKNQRIVNGTKAEEGQFPFLVSINNEGNHFCGGSILDNWNVITAAHCCDSFSTLSQQQLRENITLRFGLISLKMSNLVNRSVSSYRIHPSWKNETFFNDVCVLHLNESLALTNEGPLSVISIGNSQDCPPLKFCFVAGWGHLKFIGEISDDLMYARIPILRPRACKLYNSFDPAIQTCAGYLKGGVDSCQADSGGPLICKSFLCGLVSRGYKCAERFFPGIYANIPAFRNWILENTKKI